jgi:hypothetical protein
MRQKFTAACAVLVDALFLRAKAELAWNRLISTKRSIPTHGLYANGGLVTPAASGSDGGAVCISAGDTHITIQGSADKETVAMLKSELAARDAAFASNVVATVKKAKQGRIL